MSTLSKRRENYQMTSWKYLYMIMYAIQWTIIIGKVEATENAISFCFLHLGLFSFITMWTFVRSNSAPDIDVGNYRYKNWETEWEELPAMEVQQ